MKEMMALFFGRLFIFGVVVGMLPEIEGDPAGDHEMVLAGHLLPLQPAHQQLHQLRRHDFADRGVYRQRWRPMSRPARKGT